MRLRRSNLDRPGIQRMRRGKGFTYRGPDGLPADEATRERIAALVIPPAWQQVWICPYPNGHIQAVGTDAAGRRQYLYHDQWRLAQDEQKHARVLRMARRLPAVREVVESDLALAGLGRERVMATALRILDYGMFRVGGETYVEENGTHGVATLLRQHVHVSRGRIVFEFPAKGGIDRSVSLVDPPLAAVVTALRRARTGTDRLLVFRTATGWNELHADVVNARFKALAGQSYTVKDLRTWQATVIAAVAFAQLPAPHSQAARRRAERSVMTIVAEELGNTPAVARRSYVDPRVVTSFDSGRTIARTLSRLGSDDLTDPRVRHTVEGAVMRLLRG